MSFYTIDSVTFSYNGRNNLLNNISFSIAKDQHIALIGPNGCGKTTLAKLMLGIIRPQEGIIFLEGRDIRDLSLWNIGKKVGYVFQNPEKQLFCPTVWEQMTFSLKFGGCNDKDRIVHYLEIFDLARYKDSSPFELSRGEKQRLALASVLSRDVSFIILDEPTTGLDVLRKKQLEGCLMSLRKEGKGYMIISHEAGFAAKYADKLLMLRPEGVECL